MNNYLQEKRYNNLILAVSIIVPIVVLILFNVKIQNVKPLTFLPFIYAIINGITAVTLVCSFIAIKKKNKRLHERLNKFAILCSLLFLVLYIVYHMTSESTRFGGEGFVKYVYYFLLITHILLSVIVIPFVLFTYVRAQLGKFTEHKKLAKITFPLWLYVAVTGVLIYIMISPYYV